MGEFGSVTNEWFAEKASSRLKRRLDLAARQVFAEAETGAVFCQLGGL
jgi:hypothetical protein